MYSKAYAKLVESIMHSKEGAKGEEGVEEGQAKPVKINAEQLKLVLDEYDKKVMPQNRELRVLVENNKEILREIVTEIGKTRNFSCNLSQETLENWLQLLQKINCDLDETDQIRGRISLNRCLAGIAKPLPRDSSDLKKSNNDILCIFKEITAWKRKAFTEEEFKQFQTSVNELWKLEKYINNQDYDWTQFKTKILIYEWRQEVTLRLTQDISQESLHELICRAPKSIKASKPAEWNQLIERTKDVCLMDDKAIAEGVVKILNEEFTEEAKPGFLRFMVNADYSAGSPQALKNVSALKMVLQVAYPGQNESPNDLENAVKELIEARLMDTKAFQYFDEILKVIQKVINNAVVWNAGKEQISRRNEGVEVSLAEFKKMQRLKMSDIHDLHTQFCKYPDRLTQCMSNEYFLVDNHSKANRLVYLQNDLKLQSHKRALFEMCKEPKLSEISAEFKIILASYCSIPVFKEDFEENLECIETLLNANYLLNDENNASKKDIHHWDMLCNEAKRMWKDENSKPALIEELEGQINCAKQFLSKVQRLETRGEGDQELMTFEEVKTLSESPILVEGKICLSEARQYLKECVRKIESLQTALNNPKVHYKLLQELQAFMQTTSINFNGIKERFDEKLAKADALRKKLEELKKEGIEGVFPQLTEEYEHLQVIMEDVEEIFNELDNCKFIRREAERIVAVPDISIEEIFEIKAKFKGISYYKSNNMSAKLLSRLFYKLRECYESGKDKNSFKIDYEDIKMLIPEAERLQKKNLKADVEAELIEKMEIANKILKDVNDYFAKNLYSLVGKELKEKKMDDVFRGLVRIDKAVNDYKTRVENSNNEQQLMKGNGTEAGSKKHLKPEVRESLSDEMRDYYIRLWKPLLAKNSSLGIEPKDISSVARYIEKEVVKRSEESGTKHDKICSDVTSLLSEILNNQRISAHLKEKRFSFSALEAYFGKTSAELRKVNHMMPKEGKAKEDDKPDSRWVEEEKQARVWGKEEGMGGRVEGAREKGPAEYRFYRIYSGDLYVETRENLKFEKIELLTCTAHSLLVKFKQIQPNLKVTSTILKSNLLVLLDSLKTDIMGKHRIVSGYLNNFSGCEKLRRLVVEKEIVLSKQLTSNQKLFIFPREFLTRKWLEELEIYVLHKPADLIYLIIEDISDKADNQWKQPYSEPEPRPFVYNKAYKLVLQENQIKELGVSIDSLKESNPVNDLVFGGSPEPVRVQVVEPKTVLDFVRSTYDVTNRPSKNAQKTSVQAPVSQTGYIPVQQGHNYKQNYNNLMSNSQTNRDQSRNNFGYNNKKPHHQQRPEWGFKEGVSEAPEKKEGNELIGALQNAKPSRMFLSQPQAPFKTSYPSAPAFAEPAEPLHTLMPALAPAPLPPTTALNMLLAKRPPVVDPPVSLNQKNSLHFLTETTGRIDSGQADLGLGVLGTGVEKKNFLQRAISKLQGYKEPSSQAHGSQAEKQSRSKPANEPARNENYLKKKISYGQSHGGRNSQSGQAGVSILNNHYFP